MFGKDESFNSRTREGCDATGDACRRRYDVSIHAPGRGATVSSSGCRYQRRGFNSRTREGCDQCFAPPPDVRQCFNSRTREGCDSIDDITYRLYILFQFTHPGGVRQRGQLGRAQPRNVSIHAPGRGATTSISSSSRWVMMFQFTHPGGVRLDFKSISDHVVTFQFTHPGGVRLHTLHTSYNTVAFQFTHPGGVRLHKPLRTPSGTLFQFTHPGGVRLGGLCLRSCSIACFNSRTREGCDTIKPSDYVANWEFQFTHPGGVRLTDISLTLGDIRFNSRTREGCDRRYQSGKTSHRGFNSRTREGCDDIIIAAGSIALQFQFTHPGGVRPSAPINH